MGKSGDTHHFSHHFFVCLKRTGVCPHLPRRGSRVDASRASVPFTQNPGSAQFRGIWDFNSDLKTPRPAAAFIRPNSRGLFLQSAARPQCQRQANNTVTRLSRWTFHFALHGVRVPARALKNLPSSAGHEPGVAQGRDAESQRGGTSCEAPIHRVSSHCQRARRRSLRPRHAGGKANNRATAKIYVNLWATQDDKTARLPMPLRRKSPKTVSHFSTSNMLAVPVASTASGKFLL